MWLFEILYRVIGYNEILRFVELGIRYICFKGLIWFVIVLKSVFIFCKWWIREC